MRSWYVPMCVVTVLVLAMGTAFGAEAPPGASDPRSGERGFRALTGTNAAHFGVAEDLTAFRTAHLVNGLIQTCFRAAGRKPAQRWRCLPTPGRRR
jgi:hypothetical protein